MDVILKVAVLCLGLTGSVAMAAGASEASGPPAGQPAAAEQPARNVNRDDNAGDAEDSTMTQPATGLRAPFKWISTGPLITARSDGPTKLNAIKDPSVVFHDGKWHIYATSSNTDGHWGMVYISFADWADAADATQHQLDQSPQFKGYHCAPQVFYFEPHKLWYLLYQSQQPTYSTTNDLSDPASWSPPADLFKGTPTSVVDGWIDYWIIADDTHVYLFFTDDHGRFYRSRTTMAAFPAGFDDPVVVMQEARAGDLFEGGATYRVKGTGQYLTLIECASEGWQRYYKAFVSDHLDGEWAPLAASHQTPFAGLANVQFAPGVEPWTKDISHGELLRDGIDQTMTIDPSGLQLLYQGLNPDRVTDRDYGKLPWQLGLLRAAE